MGARTGRGRTATGGAHIPGSVFLDWSTDLVNAERLIAFMLSPGAVRGGRREAWNPSHHLLRRRHLGLELAFDLRLAGVRDVVVYEASWEEWGRDPARPVARG